MKIKALAFLIILIFGAAKMRFEHVLMEEHRAAFFHDAKLNLSVRQQVGQMGFLAALSGLRAVVADALVFQAHTAWENTEWGRVALLYNNITALQPRNVMFWDLAGWHMAWNASVAAMQDKSQPREALRIKAQREYFQLGRNFLERGIANNPDKYVLYERLGLLLREKFHDHCGASEAYGKASQFPDAPEYLKRFTIYEMSYCPGREREAYEQLLKLYNEGEQERMPTLLNRLRVLQEKLNIPPDQRVSLPPEKKP